MKRLNLLLTISFACILGFAQSLPTKDKVFKTMKKVADWQIEHFDDYVKGSHKDRKRWAWTNGAMYVGMLEWAKISNNDVYYNFLKQVGEQENYMPGPDVFHADDICVSQLYLGLFEKYRDSAMIKPTLKQMDYIITNRSFGNLDFQRKGNQKRWSWCDALFMAPPVYAKATRITGNPEYLKFMDEEIKVTYDTLYDKTAKLFFRDTRYKTQKEANGENIYWGRGNGWVIAGLCSIIDNLPENHPSKSFYVQTFTEMMARIASLQDKNGYWHSSLLDPKSYPMPETSSTAFFTYGMAWGMNRGLLPVEKFKKPTLKGWKALTKSVNKNGKVCWVQPIGADPKSIKKEMTEVYGVGAFLLAASEIYKLK